MSLGRTSRAGSSQKYRGTCSAALYLSPLKLGTDAYIPFSVTLKILHTLVSSTCLTALWQASCACKSKYGSLASSEMCCSQDITQPLLLTIQIHRLSGVIPLMMPMLFTV